MLFFWWLWPLFLRLKLSRGTIIAANIGQAMVNLELWLSKSSSFHRQPHGGRGLISQSLACESHTLPLGHHAKWFYFFALSRERTNKVSSSSKFLLLFVVLLLSLGLINSWAHLLSDEDQLTLLRGSSLFLSVLLSLIFVFKNNWLF